MVLKLVLWALCPAGLMLLLAGAKYTRLAAGSTLRGQSVRTLAEDCTFAPDGVWRVQRCKHRRFEFFDGTVYTALQSYAQFSLGGRVSYAAPIGLGAESDVQDSKGYRTFVL